MTPFETAVFVLKVAGWVLLIIAFTIVAVLGCIDFLRLCGRLCGLVFSWSTQHMVLSLAVVIIATLIYLIPFLPVLGEIWLR